MKRAQPPVPRQPDAKELARLRQAARRIEAQVERAMSPQEGEALIKKVRRVLEA